MNTNVKIFLGIVVLLIAGVILTVVVGVGPGSGGAVTGQYDAFATCLKDQGATFYGAWWCPHCKAQKALFGSSQKLLPYVECANAAGNAQTPACTEKKIENYPTWEFATPIKITAAEEPVVCEKAPGAAGEPAICSKSQSALFKVWIFPDATVASDTEPEHNGSDWSFAPGSQLRGEVPLEKLAKQTSCVLPQ
jgi:hypothetical protein